MRSTAAPGATEPSQNCAMNFHASLLALVQANLCIDESCLFSGGTLLISPGATKMAGSFAEVASRCRPK